MRECALVHDVLAHCATQAEVGLVGDDASFQDRPLQQLLCAMDPVIVGCHVLPEVAGKWMGRKALARNLSDLAAMGAFPRGCLLQLLLAPDVSHEKALAMVEGVLDTGKHYGCPLVGGDVSVLPEGGVTSLVVTAYGEMAEDVQPLTRRGAQLGDRIWVSGRLGGALEPGANGVDDAHHIRFDPRLALGQALAQGEELARPRCMMDLSDGLAKDLQRLVPGARVYAADLPLSAGLQTGSDSSWHHAVADGEDYELVWVGAPDQMWPEQWQGLELHCVGEVVENGFVIEDEAGVCHDISAMGYEHVGGVA